jgi:uncharacterized protein (DUF1778 family)
MALRKDELYDSYKGNQTMKRSRITIDVSPELRRRIKKAASEQDISISKFLERMLEEAVPQDASPLQFEKKPLTREKLEHVLKVREEIIAHTGGYTFENSTEVVRQMREERSKPQTYCTNKSAKALYPLKTLNLP